MTPNGRTPRLSRRIARPVSIILLLILITTVIYLWIVNGGIKLAQKTLPVPLDNIPTEIVSNVQIHYGSLTITSIIHGEWESRKEEHVRSLVGSIHRYRPRNKKSPKIVIFCERTPPIQFQEEVSLWEGVQLRLIAATLGHPILDKSFQIAQDTDQNLLWRTLIEVLFEEKSKLEPILFVRAGYIFDPIPGAVKEALGQRGTIGNPPSIIRPVYKKARQFLKQLIKRLQTDGIVVAWNDSSKEVVLEGYQDKEALKGIFNCTLNATAIASDSVDESRKSLSSDFGWVPRPEQSDSGCYVDIRFDVVSNVILARETDGNDVSFNSLSDSSLLVNKTNLAIALPVTSHGSSLSDDPVMFKALIPSIFKTISREEQKEFNILLYIGFDHGDPLWDNDARRQLIRKKINAAGLPVKMYRMPKGKRVAMLWSMLSTRAIRDGADYFFQVNDDLTLETKGWLSRSVSILRSNNDFGVVGPLDPHNGLGCIVLTQSMVSKLHFRIFGTLYPVELRDWKTDRWLTHVYNDPIYGNNTWCSDKWVARNGAARTRYKHCEFLAWQLYLEKGRAHIREWLKDSGFILKQ
jgi:hypothetical protein